MGFPFLSFSCQDFTFVNWSFLLSDPLRTFLAKGTLAFAQNGLLICCCTWSLILYHLIKDAEM